MSQPISEFAPVVSADGRTFKTPPMPTVDFLMKLEANTQTSAVLSLSVPLMIMAVTIAIALNIVSTDGAAPDRDAVLAMLVALAGGSLLAIFSAVTWPAFLWRRKLEDNLVFAYVPQAIANTLVCDVLEFCDNSGRSRLRPEFARRIWHVRVTGSDTLIDVARIRRLSVITEMDNDLIRYNRLNDRLPLEPGYRERLMAPYAEKFAAVETEALKNLVTLARDGKFEKRDTLPFPALV